MWSIVIKNPFSSSRSTEGEASQLFFRLPFRRSRTMATPCRCSPTSKSKFWMKTTRHPTSWRSVTMATSARHHQWGPPWRAMPACLRRWPSWLWITMWRRWGWKLYRAVTDRRHCKIINSLTNQIITLNDQNNDIVNTENNAEVLFLQHQTLSNKHKIIYVCVILQPYTSEVSLIWFVTSSSSIADGQWDACRYQPSSLLLSFSSFCWVLWSFDWSTLTRKRVHSLYLWLDWLKFIYSISMQIAAKCFMATC